MLNRYIVLVFEHEIGSIIKLNKTTIVIDEIKRIFRGHKQWKNFVNKINNMLLQFIRIYLEGFF